MLTHHVFEERRPSTGEWARYHATGAGVELFEAAFRQFTYERHFHDRYAIGVTRSGIQRFWCRGTTFDSMPGDILVIPPGEVHDGESGTIGGGGYAYRMFYITEAFLLDVAGDLLEGPTANVPLRQVPLVRDTRVARYLDAAWRAARADATSLAAEELLARACARLVSDSAEAAANRVAVDRTTLARVRDYLSAHVGTRVGMRELAAIAGMSRFRLTRQFQRQFGLPVHAYHLQLRLHEAKRRLRAGDTISAVALDLGFADQSHLHRRFKGAFGITPGAWRTLGPPAARGRPI